MTKKEFLKGIEIPVECGKADCIDAIFIMYQDMNKEQYGSKYNVYITEEDFKDKKPFTSFISNMNPAMVTFENEEARDGKNIVDWDLVDFDAVIEDGLDYAIIVTKSGIDYEWNYSTFERNEYLSVTPKAVLKYGDGLYYYVEKL